MIKRYLDGAICQLIERGRLMVANIPRDLPRAYDTLAQNCRGKINALVADLRCLNDAKVFLSPTSQSERLRKFKRIVADLDFLETIGIAALKKAQKDDHHLNSLLERIATEIQYPSETPVATPLSNSYFHIFPDLRLLRVPLVERHFLLHLPDLYHELAHPLLIEENDPIIEPLQQQYLQSLRDCLSYVQEEQIKEQRRRGPAKSQYMLRAWESSWARFWVTEFYCDIFGAFTTGPAYAWSHLHLVAKRGANPFEVPEFGASSHPADDARMRAVLLAAERNHFPDDEISVIRAAWQDLLDTTGAKAEPEYDWCFPRQLLEKLVSNCFAGLQQVNIRPHLPRTTGTVAATLNSAWNQFWKDTTGFSEWEKQQVEVMIRETRE